MNYIVMFLALLAFNAPACAASAELPKRKSGLWEIKMTDAAAKGTAMEQCIDEKTDDMMKDNARGMEPSACSKTEIRRDGDRVVSETVCKISGSSVKTRAVFTGRFDSAYKADIKSSYDPPLHGMRDSSSTFEAKWLGACKPGQKPGDMSMPGMPNINLNDMMKHMPKR